MLYSWLLQARQEETKFQLARALDSVCEKVEETLALAVHSFLFTRILNIPFFLPIYGWKYSCNILHYSFCSSGGAKWTNKNGHSIFISPPPPPPKILYCTNTLHVPFVIEHLAITSEECLVCWLVLPFRERCNSIELSKNISLYCIYRFSTHEIIFFSQFQPHL